MATKNLAKIVGEDFYSALLDLKQNSKPHINMLTMLAEENIKYAYQIVEIIAKHIKETNYKLSAMYLMDSILKNIGQEYQRLFASHLVLIFSSVFKHVEEGTRKKLYDLRQTWNDIFPPSRLYMLDVTIKEIDPAWPLTAMPKIAPQAQTIHINPKFKGSRVNFESPLVLQNNKVNVSEFPSAFPVAAVESRKRDSKNVHERRVHQEKNRQTQHEKNRQIQHEKERQPQYEKNRQTQHQKERQGQYEKNRLTQHEKERQAQREKERQAQCEKERQVQYEKDKQVQYEKDRQVQHEKERKAQHEKERKAQHENDQKVQHEKDRNTQHKIEQKVQHEKDKNVQHETEQKVQHELDINVQHEKERSVQHEKEERSIQQEKERSVQQEKERSVQQEKERNVQQEKERSVQHEKEGKVQHEKPKVEQIHGHTEANKSSPVKKQKQTDNTLDKSVLDITAEIENNRDIVNTNSEDDSKTKEQLDQNVNPDGKDEDSTPPTRSESSPSPKRSQDDSYTNGNDGNNIKKARIELEHKQAEPSGDVDLREVSMHQNKPFSSNKEDEDPALSLFGKEDVDYRQLQFPPLPMPPIFPMPTITSLPGIIPNFLPGIVPNPSVIVNTTIQQTSAPTISQTSTIAETYPLSSSPSINVITQDVNQSGTQGSELVFDELSAGGLISQPIVRESVSPVNGFSPIPSPTILSTSQNTVTGQSIDLTPGSNKEIDSDIMCIEDMRNKYIGTYAPQMAESNNDYYSIMSDIDDQLQWVNISREEYNTLIVRLQEARQANELGNFRLKYMSNMKCPRGASIINFNKMKKSPRHNRNSYKATEQMQPPAQFGTPVGTAGFDMYNQQHNSSLRMPIPLQNALFPINNVRPFYPPPSSSSTQQTSNDTFATCHPPANMVPQIRALEPSLSFLQSILSNIGQVNPTPKPQQGRGGGGAHGRYNRGRNNRRGRNYRNDRTDSRDMIPVADQKWLPQKEDMWHPKFLKRRNDFLVKAIHFGVQCSSCGLRFKPEDKEKYSRHLDWHFRMNKKQQESTRKANCRNWFVNSPYWKMYEEMDSEEPSGSTLFDEMSGSEGSDEVDDEDIPSVAVVSDASHLSMCPECHETFKNFFHQDMDEWHYKNAVDKDGLNYHPLCYKDVEKRKERMDAEDAEITMLPHEVSTDRPTSVNNESVCSLGHVSLPTETPSVSVTRILDGDSLQKSDGTSGNNYIKQETISIEDGIDMFIPPPMPRLLADLPLKMEIKEEEFDDVIEENAVLDEDSDINEIDESLEVEDRAENTTKETDLSDIIDGNVVSTPIISRPVPLIRISMSKNHSQSPKVNEIIPSAPTNVIRDLVKPAFEGVQLTEQPPVHRGMELSSLCSIM